MQFPSLIISISIFLFGAYILRIGPRKPVQKYFFLLCLFLSLWCSAFALRGLVPVEYRNLALNLTAIPSIFAPYIFFRLVRSIAGEEKINKVFLFLNLLIVLYFVLCGLSSSFGKLTDPETFQAEGFINYHLLNLYCGLFLTWSIFLMANNCYRTKGMVKVQSVLLLAGSLLALLICLSFVYFLPFQGINRSYLSSFGVAIFLFLWSIAIIQYDVFEIREDLLQGNTVSFLNRLTWKPVLMLYRIIDSEDYNSRLFLSQRNALAEIVGYDYYLLSKISSSEEEILEALWVKFRNYLR